MEQPTGDTSVPNQSGLDRNLADPELKERAVRALVDDAGRATEIARGNVFSLAVPGLRPEPCGSFLYRTGRYRPGAGERARQASPLTVRSTSIYWGTAGVPGSCRRSASISRASS